MKKTFQNVIFDLKMNQSRNQFYFAIMLSTGILQKTYSSDMMVIVGLSAENSEMLLRYKCYHLYLVLMTNSHSTW